MKNIAIIPARSGSKGLKDKNIKPLNGKPLIAYTIEAAIESNLFNEIMVSTDSEQYAEIAKEWGAKVPFLRSEESSTDIASSWDVVKEVLREYEKLGKEFDTVALLQPTSPLRRSKDIVEAYNIMKEKNANTVIAVCEVEHSPLWSNVLPDDKSLNSFIDTNLSKLPRQSLPTYYRINGALYIRKVDHIFNENSIYGEDSFALVMSRKNSIDIDDDMDFKIAEVLMNKYR